MTHHTPAHEVELYREDDAYVVYVELPGYDREDIEVRLVDHRLHVSADHEADERRGQAVYHRSIGLPHVVEADRATATYEDGVLVVTVPVTERRRKPGRVVPIDD
jgi:HSP20 family protein